MRSSIKGEDWSTISLNPRNRSAIVTDRVRIWIAIGTSAAVTAILTTGDRAEDSGRVRSVFRRSFL